MSAPIDTPRLSPPHLPMLAVSRSTSIGAEGASALAAVLKETQISTLECAAAPPTCSLLCQRPLTRLTCLRSLASNSSAARVIGAAPTCEGISKLLRGPQGQRRDLARVRRPRVFAFVSAPVDTPTLSPFPSCPSLAASRTTTSERRARPRSRPSSRRRRSPP